MTSVWWNSWCDNVLPQDGYTSLMCAADGGCNQLITDILKAKSIDINAVNKVCKVFVW